MHPFSLESVQAKLGSYLRGITRANPGSYVHGITRAKPGPYTHEIGNYLGEARAIYPLNYSPLCLGVDAGIIDVLALSRNIGEMMGIGS